VSSAAFLLAAALAQATAATAPPKIDAPPGAKYALALETAPRLRVAATLTLSAVDAESSAFSVAPEWGGVDHCARYLHDVAFFVDGAPAAAGAVDHPLETAWVVSHHKGAQVEARWWFDPLPAGGDAALGNDYRPRVEPKLFLLLGDVGLLTPDALGGPQPRRIAFEWIGLEEAGWRHVTSFGEANAFTTTRPLDAFKHALFMAGDLRVTAIEKNGTKLLFAFHGDGFAFEDGALAGLAARIVAAERDFFSDWSDPFFLVTLVPDDRKDRHSLGGTALTDSFALYMSKEYTLAPGSDDEGRVAQLLAHEYFHRWNGGKIGLEKPEQLGYWFSEGFTDFFARRILLRCGILDPPAYVRRVNESLENYWKSPVRHEPAARIVADFWKRRDVADLPYRRGDLVALFLDHEIRATTNGERSLDDWFREALTRVRDRGESCSTDHLLELAAEWTSDGFAESLRRLIVDGADVELDEELGAPFCELQWTKTKTAARAELAIPRFELLPDADLAKAVQQM
jgi:predicted metalloprotease with PDZ domain